MTRESAREIDAAAARWVACADRGLSPSEEVALEAWLAKDTRRQGSYAKARAVALHTERARALAPNYDPRMFAPSSPALLTRRRMLLGGGGAIAASVAIAVAMGARIVGARFSTRRGEVRVVPLADGSVITLNTASKVIVSYSKRRRDVRLLEGEALFDVAKDPARPFVVASDDTLVRAVGTSFAVRRLSGAPVQVLVREGVVEVTHRDVGSKVRLAANTKAVAAPTSSSPVKTAAVPESEMGRELAWKDGRIAFQGETLEQAALEFARYSDTQIVIDDPRLRREEITGLFEANDPVGFARAAAIALNAHAEVRSNEVRITR